MKTLKRWNKGISIIEFIVAIALLAVVMVPLLMTFGGAYSLIARSKDAVALNSVARQIKVDVYMAYREGKDLKNYEGDDEAPPTTGASISGYGWWEYQRNRIHPNYQYTITRFNDIFYTTGPGIDLGYLTEVRCLVDIYKADATGKFDDENIARSFFINIPINFIKDGSSNEN
jgi:hypothetical protein